MSLIFNSFELQSFYYLKSPSKFMWIQTRICSQHFFIIIIIIIIIFWMF